jgi:hypothetical protein
MTNEPISVEEPCDAARAMWKEWLEKHHQTIQQLNQRYGSHYASFADVPLPNPYKKPAEKWLWLDFVRFNQEFFAAWHRMLADVIHEIAPNVPVHSKPTVDMMVTSTRWPSLSTEYGTDATLFGRFSNMNGCDALAFYTKGAEFANDAWTEWMGYDLMRSVLDAPVVNSENHVIRDRERNLIPAQHIREMLWQEAIHGQSATTVWVWQECFEPDSCFAGNIMYRPACTEAIGRVNGDLNRAADEVTALQQAKPDVLILHSMTGSVWDGERYEPCELALYKALAFTGLKIGFVTERQLESGLVPETRVVLVPNIAHLSQDAATTLRKYRGRLVLIGDKDVLAFDEYGHERKKKLRGEVMAITVKTGDLAQYLFHSICVKMHNWNVKPLVEVQDEKKHPAWGVEWRCAETPKGTVINVCNYLSKPVTVSLVQAGKKISAQDILTGEHVEGPIQLNSLEVRLLRLASAKTAGE